MTEDKSSLEESHDRSRSRLRGVAMWVLVSLSLVGLLASTLAIWTRAVLLDTDRFSVIVSDVVAEPQLRAAIADRVSRELSSALVESDALNNLVPSQLTVVVPLLGSTLEPVIARQVERLLADPNVQALVVSGIADVHRLAVTLIRDGLPPGSPVKVNGDQLQLNTLPLMARALEALQELGVLTRIQVPDLSTVGDYEAQRSAIEDAIGRSLPDSFGLVTVYQGDAVESASSTVLMARQALGYFERGVVAIVIVTLLLMSGAVLVAERRWRAVGALGVATIVGMLLANLVIRKVTGSIPGLIADQAFAAAAEQLVSRVTLGLRRLLILLVLVGGAAVGASWLASYPNRSKVILRTIAKYQDASRVVVACAALAVLWSLGLSAAGLFVAAAVVALGLVLVNFAKSHDATAAL